MHSVLERGFFLHELLHPCSLTWSLIKYSEVRIRHVCCLNRHSNDIVIKPGTSWKSYDATANHHRSWKHTELSASVIFPSFCPSTQLSVNILEGSFGLHFENLPQTLEWDLSNNLLSIFIPAACASLSITVFPSSRFLINIFGSSTLSSLTDSM